MARLRMSVSRGFQIIGVLALLTLSFQNCAGPNQINPLDLTSAQAAVLPPTFSTYSSATRFATATVNTWQYTGESITITVPNGPNVQYRLFLRQMAYSSVTGSFITTLSTSSAAVANIPQGMGYPYQIAQAGIWSTVTTEGYVNLPPGTHTFYVMVDNATSGTLTLANATTDGDSFCVITAWPL